MDKQALHADDRLRERTRLNPQVLQRLRRSVASARLPRGTHHVSLKGEGYAVLKDVGGRHVVATILSRHMHPPGKDVTGRLVKVARSDEEMTMSAEARQRRASPPPPVPQGPATPAQQAAVNAKPIMAPAAQQLLFNSFLQGQVNPHQVAQAVYSPADRGVRGSGLQKAMDVASQYSSASPNQYRLNRTIPVSTGGTASGQYYPSPGPGRILVNPKAETNKDPHRYLDTLGHEVGHAMDFARGRFDFTDKKVLNKEPQFQVAPQEGQESHYRAAHEMMAGPVRAAKWYMVQETGHVPSNPQEADQQIRAFYKKHPDPSKSFPAYYRKNAWDAFLKSPDRAKFYLQTVRNQSAPNTPQVPGVPQAPTPVVPNAAPPRMMA